MRVEERAEERAEEVRVEERGEGGGEGRGGQLVDQHYYVGGNRLLGRRSLI